MSIYLSVYIFTLKTNLIHNYTYKPYNIHITQPNIMKDNHFKLSSSFTSLFTNKQTANTNLNPNHNQSKSNTNVKASSGNSLDKGLFKLNPKVAHTLQDIPVDLLRKRSKNKLESLKDGQHGRTGQDRQKWSIFEQKLEGKELREGHSKDNKKFMPKKYHLDINAQSKKGQQNKNQSIDTELPYNIVRPSRLQNINNSTSSHDPSCSIFQTPLLPCFASEFRHHPTQPLPNTFSSVSQFKTIDEKQGVWKIGKIKISRKNPNKAKININGIQFQAVRAEVCGRAGIIDQVQDNFVEINNWKYIWVVQPAQHLYQ